MSSKGKSSFGLNMRTLGRVLYAEIFTYSTVRSASIENKLVAVIYRLVQLAILAYIIGFDIIWNKGYQVRDTATSTVTSKVKGLGFVNHSYANVRYLRANEILNSNNNLRMFDVADYIVPPNEFNSLFIMSNFIETIQTQDKCEESFKRSSALCKVDFDCQKKFEALNTWSGIPTGKCLNTNKKVKNESVSICEIIAWCPVEEDPIDDALNVIQNTLSYTIFIKNDVDFKKFKKKERNILPWITNKYISSCNYHKTHDPYCPVFLVDYILKEAEPDAEERQTMLIKGGVVLIDISWICNYDLSKLCLPVYSFKRFDLPFKQRSASSGFNFRFANKYVVDGKEYRTLYKAYGLRFIVSATGTAGKFSILPLMLTIGAGLGLMGISVIIADLVMLNFTEKKKLFQKLKELDAKEVDHNPELIEKAEELIVK